jgi:hypothetical protein
VQGLFCIFVHSIVIRVTILHHLIIFLGLTSEAKFHIQANLLLLLQQSLLVPNKLG